MAAVSDFAPRVSKWWKPLLHAAALICFFLAGTVGGLQVAVGPWTRYAPGFSRWRFHQIHVGDSQQRVFELLGEPLVRERNGWFYSEPLRTKGNYYFFALGFDRTGRVKSITDQLWFD